MLVTMALVSKTFIAEDFLMAAIVVAQIAAMAILSRALLGKQLDQHAQAGGKFSSNWFAAAIALGVLAALIVLLTVTGILRPQPNVE